MNYTKVNYKATSPESVTEGSLQLLSIQQHQFLL